MTYRIVSSIILASFLALPLASQAQDPAPRDVRYLEGGRASSGEAELKKRGWELYKVEKGSDRVWTNWWHQAKRTCMTVVTLDGRYNSMVTVPTGDCGIYDAGGGSESHSGSKWLDDLVGGRASGAEYVLKERDYHNVGGHKDTGKSYTFWRNDKAKACLRMTVSEGRVESIEPDRGACNSSSNSSGHGGGKHYEIHGVSDNKLRIWSRPSKGSDVVAGGVQNGERVRGVGNCERHHGEQWCEVEYKGDRGWVMEKFLR